MSAPQFTPGHEFTVVYPFVRDVFQEFGCDDVPTWKPGVRYENIGPEDGGFMADDEGLARFKVEGVFRPGKFPTRVFYTRRFVDPDGKEFGKNKLLTATLGKFRALIRGYRIAYGVGGPLFPQRSTEHLRADIERLMAEARGEQ